MKIWISITIFNIDNKKKGFRAPNQHIRLISVGSRDTEDSWKFSFAITGINYIKNIKIENKY